MSRAEAHGTLIGRGGLCQCPQLVVQCGRLEQAVEATRVKLQGPSEGLHRGRGSVGGGQGEGGHYCARGVGRIMQDGIAVCVTEAVRVTAHGQYGGQCAPTTTLRAAVCLPSAW